MNLGSVWIDLDNTDRKLIKALMKTHHKYKDDKKEHLLLFYDVDYIKTMLDKNIHNIEKNFTSLYSWCPDEIERCRKMINLIKAVS
jgi:hypothetical protein